jgi:hypothetical protein
MKDVARALALLAIAAIASPARAGNLDAVFVSDQAAMMRGAALFAAYTAAILHLDFAGLQHADEVAVASTQVSINDEALQLGALATLGVQRQPRPDVIVVWLGAGVFTDRTPDRFDPSSLLSRSVDFYGRRAGVVRP